MKYRIFRANCKFSDGSTRVIKYDENKTTEENTCNSIEAFRALLKNMLNKSLGVLGITVVNITLTYEERGGRQ